MDNHTDIIEKDTVSKKNSICGIISLVLLALAILSIFLPAFKISIFGFNVSYSLFDIYTGSNVRKIVLGLYALLLGLCIIPIVVKKYNFAKLLIVITGIFSIALPVARLISLKLSDEGEEELSSFALSLITPDIGFYLMCIVGIAMIVVGCLLKKNDAPQEISEL